MHRAFIVPAPIRSSAPFGAHNVPEHAVGEVCAGIGNGNTSLIASGKSAAVQLSVLDLYWCEAWQAERNPKSKGASAVKLLRPLKLIRKGFTLPGSIWREDNPVAISGQSNFRALPVQICALCAKRVPRTTCASLLLLAPDGHGLFYPRVTTIRFVRWSYTTYCFLFCAASSSIRLLADTKSRAASTQISSASICSKISYCGEVTNSSVPSAAFSI